MVQLLEFIEFSQLLFNIDFLGKFEKLKKLNDENPSSMSLLVGSFDPIDGDIQLVPKHSHLVIIHMSCVQVTATL